MKVGVCFFKKIKSCFVKGAVQKEEIWRQLIRIWDEGRPQISKKPSIQHSTLLVAQPGQLSRSTLVFTSSEKGDESRWVDPLTPPKKEGGEQRIQLLLRALQE